MHARQVCFWSPHAHYLPVDLVLIIIHVYKLSSHGTGRRTSCIQDEQTATAWAHRSGHGHEFIHSKTSPSSQGPASPLCPSREQTFMKTFPQNLYISITIQSSCYLHHDRIVALPTLQPTNPPINPHPHCSTTPISSVLYLRTLGESAVSACPLGCVERCLAAASRTPHSSHFKWLHPPPSIMGGISAD